MHSFKAKWTAFLGRYAFSVKKGAMYLVGKTVLESNFIAARRSYVFPKIFACGIVRYRGGYSSSKE